MGYIFCPFTHATERNYLHYIYVFHYCYSLVYSMLVININLYNCSCNYICCSCNCICIVFIVCSVSFIVRVVLCAVFCLSVVCYFVWCVICVLCLIVVHCHRVKPFSVKINNDNNIKLNSLSIHGDVTPIMEVPYIIFHQNILND
jgi:hypothetical protein